MPREWMFLECTDCGARRYRTTKGKTKTAKLELKKFCSICRGHRLHREKRK